MGIEHFQLIFYQLSKVEAKLNNYHNHYAAQNQKT